MSDIMLNGGQSERASSVVKNFVGLGAVKLVAVNPNKKELEVLLGRDLERDPDYSIKEDQNGVKTRPLSLWFENSEGKIISERLYMGNKPITTKDGDKFKFINALGQISYFSPTAEDIQNNPKVNKWYKPNGMRKLLLGEDILYQTLQAFTRYDARAEGANWMEVMNNIKLTGEEIYGGNFDGLKKFAQYIQDNNNQLIVLHAVKRRETDEGVRYNQQLVLREETMFRTTNGEIMEWMFGKLKEFKSAQVAAGYEITNADYLIGALAPYVPNSFEDEANVPKDVVGKFIDI